MNGTKVDGVMRNTMLYEAIAALHISRATPIFREITVNKKKKEIIINISCYVEKAVLGHKSCTTYCTNCSKLVMCLCGYCLSSAKNLSQWT